MDAPYWRRRSRPAPRPNRAAMEQNAKSPVVFASNTVTVSARRLTCWIVMRRVFFSRPAWRPAQPVAASFTISAPRRSPATAFDGLVDVIGESCLSRGGRLSSGAHLLTPVRWHFYLNRALRSAASKRRSCQSAIAPRRGLLSEVLT